MNADRPGVSQVVGIVTRAGDRGGLAEFERRGAGCPATDRGSASLWVLAGGALVLLVALFAIARGSAVVARERAESAADLASLAVAGGIGVDASTVLMCARGRAVAAANDARVDRCTVTLGADGRTGTVDVTVSVVVRLAVVGSARVGATSRAGRLSWNRAAVGVPP